ncbi:MAG: hypothetical protein WC894_01065 [Patescibacteria group bacterium]
MLNFIYKNRYKFVLSLIVMILIGRNYVPGTWLTGWDNLHPEFDFKMNIYRSIYSVWQEYQGLGLLAGMAHASDLPRQIFLWMMSMFMPTSVLRYFFHFLMLGVGTLGMYHILDRVILHEYDSANRSKVAFLGGLFYLLNFGTIQYFYTPFEPYSTFWGLFPWEIFFLMKTLNKPNKKNLVLLALINLLATPQAYVQTIFLVYIICVITILAINFYRNYSKQNIFLSIKILLIIFCINAFWLIPNIYFTFKDIRVTQNAMNNMMNSQRFFEINKKHGTLWDFALLKGFSYDFTDFDTNTNTPIYMMSVWRNHFKSPATNFIGLTFFAIIIFGLTRKNKYRSYLLGIFLIAAIPMLSDTPIFSTINNVFLRSLPIIGQIIRNPFTKFIVPLIFAFSISFAIGTIYIMNFYLKHKRNTLLFVALTSLAIVWYCQPAFSGNLIYYRLRSEIPKEYFKMFNFFRNQDKNGRIMNLPQDSYWGWGTHKWGSTGSGFLWYGIEQPIMDRAFDVWSDELEQYYWELNYALQKRDKKKFDQILRKYQIRYIIFDDNYSPSDSLSIKNLFEQEKLLEGNIQIASFGGIKIYETGINNEFFNNISIAGPLKTAMVQDKYDFVDNTYLKVGNYINQLENIEPDYYFPFQNLFTNRFQDELKTPILETKNNFEISNIIPQGKYNLSIPKLMNTETLIPTKVFASKNENFLQLRFYIIEPLIFINNKQIKSDVQYFDITAKTGANTITIEINDKDILTTNKLGKELTYIGSTYLINKGSENLINIYGEISKTLISSHSIKLDDLTNKDSQLISVDNPISNGTLKVIIEKINSIYTHQNLISTSQYKKTNISHNELSENNEYEIQNIDNEQGLRLYSKNDYTNFWLDIDDWDASSSYVIDLESRNIEGVPSTINISSKKNKIKFVNTLLKSPTSWSKSFYILPAFYEFDQGLRILFNNNSFNHSPSIMDIKDISIYPFPFNLISNINFSKPDLLQPENINNISLDVKKNSISNYKVTFNNVDQPSTLIFSQAYDDGWIVISDWKILPHIVVNNWANGWKINNEAMNQLNNGTITIIFWPQYLEFLGFVLLAISFFAILKIKEKHE